MNQDNIILPVAIRVAAKSISGDLVTVKPMDMPSGYNSKDKLDKMMSDIKIENRDSKIDAIINDSEYKEKLIKDHPEYNSGLFYLDYKFK